MARIEEAIIDFLKGSGTFYASLVSQMHRMVDTKHTPTVSVSIKNGRINMKYNPEFLEPRTMKDTKAILEHECLHIVMEHHARAKGRELEKWKVACDLAINQMLRYLPPDGITIEGIFGQDMHKLNIMRNEKAEYYYDKIKESKEAQKKIKDMTGEGKCGCGDDLEPSEGDDIDGELSNEIIKQTVAEAVKAARAQGHLPSNLETILEDLFKPSKVSWRTLLRRFVSNSVKSGTKASWKKPSRRYGDTQKGRIADRTVALTIVIDTSGSIDDGMLQEFMNEVVAIQSCYKSVITVLECDAIVQREYKLRKFEKLRRDTRGHGGTSFKPPFKYLKEKNIRTDALIYFTDLCGDFPDKKPNIPTLWGYYCGYPTQHTPQVPFGTVIPLDKEPNK